MAAPKLQYASGNAGSTTTSTSMTNTDTSVPLTSTTNFSAAPTPGEGMLLLNEGAASEELAYGTGLSGGSVTVPLANRGLEGGSAQAHTTGVSVTSVLSAGMWNNMITALLNVLLQTTGALDTTKVVDLTTAQTLTNKTLTTPFIASFYQDAGATKLMTVPAVASDTLAVLGAAQTFTATNTFKQNNWTNNAITASSNAATVPITHRLNTVTNNSAATLTITMTTTSAVDGQLSEVRILDFSAVAQTITWVNTENSTATAPTTSNGSTTLPLSVLFQYNGGTSKWRCLAST